MILQSKIHPDNLSSSSRIISRPGIIASITDNFEKKLFVIKAPAGYGKTTLASQVVKSTGIEHAYYRITDDDNNLHKVFTYLISAIEFTQPHCLNESRNYLETFRNQLSAVKPNITSIDGLLSILINELYNIKSNLIIVLDDFHELSGSENILRSFKHLFTESPANIKFIITTREEISIGLASFIARRKAYLVETDLLEFSPKEIKSISEEIYNRDLNDSEAKQIHSITEGWISGIHLSLQSGIENISNTIPENVYEYFAEEIFSRLDEDVQKFLIYTSIPEDFDEKISHFLFSDMDTETAIEQIYKKNVFVNKVDSGNTSKDAKYTYSTLFRHFLNKRFNQEVSEKLRRDYFKKLGEYFEKIKINDEAVKYYILSGSYESLPLIKSSIKTKLSEDLNLANQWLAFIPADIKVQESELMLYEGMLKKNLLSDFDAAIALFEKAANSTASSEELKVKAESAISEIYIRQSDFDKAENILNKIIKKYDHPSIARSYFNLSVIYLRTSKYDKSEKAVSKALEIIENTPDNKELENLRIEVMNILGSIYLVRGDYVKSSYYFEYCAANMPSRFKQFQIYNNVLRVNIYAGDFKRAFETKMLLQNYSSLSELPELKSSYFQSLLILYYEAGDYEKSIEYCNLLLKHARKYKMEENEFYSLLTLAKNYYYLRKNDTASKYLDLAKEITGIITDGHNAEIEMLDGLIHKARKSYSEALKLFQKSYAFFEENNIESDKLLVGFYIAGILMEKGALDKAKNDLFRVFEESEKGGRIGIFNRELIYDKTVFEFAISHGICKDFVSSIYSEVFSREILANFSPDAQIRINRAIESLYSIRLELFGPGKIFQEGVELAKPKWTRKNFKPIFFYIFIHNRERFTKDFIVDTFLSDVPYEHIDNVFHQLLSSIRSVLKLKGQEKKDYLIYKNKMLTINDNYYYYTDVGEFQEIYAGVLSAQEISPEINAMIKKAVGLFKGNFLEGMYEPWVEDLRTELEGKYLKLLDIALEASLAKKEYDNIILFTDLMIKKDDLNENAYTENIKALLAAGNEKAAHTRMEEMKSVFLSELGELPSRKIIQKIESLLK